MNDAMACGGRSGAAFADLREIVSRVNDLLVAKNLLAWDARTKMPPGGTESRAAALAAVTEAARDLLAADGTLVALDRAEATLAGLPPDAPERAACAAVRRAVEHHRRVPAALVARRARLATLGQAAWEEARLRADYNGFAPVLAEIVALDRETAEAIGYDRHPYDALLARFEPGETLAGLRPLFARLKQALLPLVRAAAEAPPPRTDFLARRYPAERQLAFARMLAEKVGYDFRRGRVDTAVHPFEIPLTRDDVRITTRTFEAWLPACLFGTLHEAGHGIYEQGVDPALMGGPFAADLVALYAAGGASYGVHESQSRLWENHLGRSRPFWARYFPALRAAFPDALADVDAETFWRGVNASAPGLIRVEADEITYDLHILFRVELEAALVEGSLTVADLPEAWNAAVAETLGLVVPDPVRGVLQDVHWAAAALGSFPTYTIGNVMAAQLIATARGLPAIAAALDAGDPAPLRSWLAEHIHRHGRRFGRDDLLVRATGRPLDSAPYLDYLATKRAELAA